MLSQVVPGYIGSQGSGSPQGHVGPVFETCWRSESGWTDLSRVFPGPLTGLRVGLGAVESLTSRAGRFTRLPTEPTDFHPCRAASVAKRIWCRIVEIGAYRWVNHCSGSFSWRVATLSPDAQGACRWHVPKTIIRSNILSFPLGSNLVRGR